MIDQQLTTEEANVFQSLSSMILGSHTSDNKEDRLSQDAVNCIANGVLDLETESAGVDDSASHSNSSNQPESFGHSLTTETEFVDWLSKINVSHHNAIAALAGGRTNVSCQVATGNSRDPLTPFEYRCRTKWNDPTCPYKTYRLAEFRKHLGICSSDKLQKIHEREKNQLACPRDGCSKVYVGTNAKRNLGTHIRQVHDWKPQRCDKEGCEDQTLFATEKKFRDHIKNVYEEVFEPGRCAVPGLQVA